MNETLIQLRERALRDAAFRRQLLETRNAADPLLALCDFATGTRTLEAQEQKEISQPGGKAR